MSWKSICFLVAMATQIILFIRKRKSLRFNQVILNKLIELVPKLPSTLIKDAHKPVIELCAGRLFAGQPCKAILNNSPPVAYSRLLVQPTTTSLMKKVIKTQIPSFFKLSDQLTHIPIYQTKSVPILTTKYFTRAQPKSFTSQLFNILLRIVFRTDYIDISAERFREEYLSDGQSALVLGQFAKDGPNSASCMNPYLIGTKKSKMVSHLSTKVFTDKLIMFLLGVGIIISLSFLIRSLIKSLKQSRRKLVDMNIAQVIVRSRICSDCRNKVSCIINKTCSHMTLCQDCLLQHVRCVQCKQRNDHTLMLYAC